MKNNTTCSWSDKIPPITAALFITRSIRTSTTIAQLQSSRALICPFFIDRYASELEPARFQQLAKRIARCYEARFKFLTALESVQTPLGI